jgi:hypothetical protein
MAISTISQQIEFHNLPDDSGRYAALSVPFVGYIRSFAMVPDDGSASGDLFLSTVDPALG